MGECLNEQQVLDYVSGTSPEVARAALERHLVDCSECTELVAMVATALPSAETENSAASIASTSTRFGPFVIEAPLGHGGMGVVFLARHERTGELTAVKSARFRTVGASASIRREIQILEQLNHPGVVRMLDNGIEDGLPWYAMELVDGVTLDDYAKSLRGGVGKAPATVLMTTMRRLAETLGYLHSVGVAHRDLSPRNVLVRAGNVPVLIDFGLAVRTFDAVEHVELNAWRAGTVPYLAPELIRGNSSDDRPADLYGFGCILYQVLTGVPPFAGQTEEDVLRSHLRTVPIPPSEKVPAIELELDELVVRLLAKSPSERVRYSRDIADKLGELGGQDWEVHPPRVRPEYLSRPALVGRDDALDRMLILAAGVRRGCGAKFLVSGPSGIGKSRLASEGAAKARSLGIQVICGTCGAQPTQSGDVGPAPGSLTALRPLLRGLAERARVGGRATAERLLGARANLLLPFEPELGAVPGFEPRLQHARLPPLATQQRLLDALVDCVIALAAESPLLLVIDDLQWADDLTRRFIKRLTPPLLAARALGVIGTVRDDETLPRSASRLLDQSEIRIGPLGEIDVCQIICEMLAVPIAPSSLVAAIVERADGSPFFVAEYLRTALAEGLLWRDGVGAWQFPTPEKGRTELPPLSLPDGVRKLVERRLSRLSLSARSITEIAAAIGRDCTTQILMSASVTGGLVLDKRLDLVTALEELVAKQVFEQTAGDRYRFVHDQLREVTYAGVLPDRRLQLHAAIAGALDQAGQLSTMLPRELAELGHHYSLANNDSEAIRFLKAAGEQALLAGAAREARALLGRALELQIAKADNQTNSGTLARLCGEAAFGLGDLDDARDKLVSSLVGMGLRVPTTTLRWGQLLLAQATRQLIHRIGPRVLVRTKPERHALLIEQASAAGLLAIIYYFTGESVPLLAILLLGVNCAERAQSTQTLAISYARIGYIAGLVGPASLARQYFVRAISLGERTADARALALAKYLQAFHYLGRGNWLETIDLGEQAVRLLRDLGDWQEQEVAATIVAHALYYSGHITEAERCYEQILESARKRESAQHMGWGLFLKARSQLAQGKTNGALDLLLEARALLLPLPDRLSLSICEGLLAQALLASDRLTEASEICVGLGPRTTGEVLSLAPCLHAYEAMVDVALAHWARSTGREAKQWRSKALVACNDLRRFARMFPMGVPSHLDALARCAELDTRPKRAQRLRDKGRRRAQSLGMLLGDAHKL